MATPPIIDLDALLAPIGGDNPAGIDLREDSSPGSVYYKVKDARAAARAAERSMDADDESGGLLPEWRTILELSPGILSGQAKDLEIAAWYIEALLRAEGFAGLRDGFKLAKGLVEGFWDNLYPLPDEDGVATRVGPLTGLNGESAEGTLIQPIRKVPITAGSEHAFALWHYEQALELAKISDPARVQARIENGAVSMEMIERSVRETPAALFRDLADDLRDCLAAFEELGTVLYRAAGGDAPPGGNIRSVLNAVLDGVAYIARDKLAMADAQAEAAAAAAGTALPTPADGGGAAVATARATVGGPLASREDAFKLLLQVSDFFRRTEPHSPISYTLEELVRRGRMTLPELLQELITDEEARKFFFLASGIKPPEPPPSDGY